MNPITLVVPFLITGFGYSPTVESHSTESHSSIHALGNFGAVIGLNQPYTLSSLRSNRLSLGRSCDRSRDKRLSEPNWTERQDFETYFRQAKVNGSFLLYDLQQNQHLVYNPQRAKTPFLPASTFKILNSLIALETGVIQDTNAVIKWDGVERELKDWNRDQTMKTAFKYSTVWFYQELARRIGQDRMQRYVNQVDYGNRNISGGIDQFWLEGGLRMTAQEQINFLVKLYRNQLPFSQRTMDLVKELMIYEQTSDYILRGKTGWVRGRVKPEVGWFVGYLEHGNTPYFFAINLDIIQPRDTEARIAITKNILRHVGLIRQE